MNANHQCALCGGGLTAGRCLSCDTRRWSRFVHREVVLLTVLLGVATAAFLMTRMVAASNDAVHRQQAAAWFESARGALQSGRVEAAAVALRRAVAKDPANRQYRLSLAEALAADDHDDEARRVLLALRDAQPEDPETNLHLARLEAGGADADPARRYYQSALAGLWRPEHAERRRLVRLELIDFLLAHGDPARALSELLVVAASLPDDVAVQVQVGRRFLTAGDPRGALGLFVRALRADPDSPPALAGAGESAFELGDYVRARRYLGAAPQEGGRVSELRELTELVLTGDPLAPRLGSNERRRRLLAAVDQSTRSLDICLADPSLEPRAGLESLRAEARAFRSAAAGPLVRDRSDIDEGVDLVYRIEQSIGQSCPTPLSPGDRALVLIGHRHGFEDQ